MNEQNFTDKSKWGDGPWQSEPDRRHWVDSATGLDCLIVRNRGGALCGYVGVPKGHPWFGAESGSHVLSDVEVHGGLTYADHCIEGGKICHTDAEAAHREVWWLGFDCAHSYDRSPVDAARKDFPWSGDQPYRDIGYVTGHVTSLARQVLEARL